MGKLYNFPKRSFTAAKTDNVTFSMRTSVAPIDADIRAGLRKLKARSRNEAQNNDYVKGFLRLLKNNVIGHKGIQLKPMAKGTDGKPDDLARESVLKGWTDWGKKGNCDVTGQYSWVDCQKLFLETLSRDGETLIKIVPGWTENKFRFAIQFLDTEMLDVDYNVDLRNGNTIVMGVEFNSWRRPVAYHLLTGKSTAETYSHSGRLYNRVDAKYIIHSFLPEWVWQSRGIPITTTALIRMNMLDGYEEAELVASRVGANKMGFYVNKEGSPVSIDGLAEDDGEGGYVQEASPGAFEVLPQGVEVQTFDPQHPSTAYKDFIKTCLRGMATGLGVGYNNWVGDLEGVNLSSMRHGAENEREVWRDMQRFVIESFADRVYAEWLNLALLAGVLTVNGRPLRVVDEEKHADVKWQPRGWARHDPLKDLQADEKSVALRTKSISAIIRERGEDPAEVWEELEADFNRLKDMGLELSVPDLQPTDEQDENDPEDT